MSKWNSRLLGLLFVTVLAVGSSAGCSYIDQVLAQRVTGDPARSVPAHQKFLPNHLVLLEEAGWLEFVDSNIDAVEYHSKSTLESSTGPAGGVFSHESGRRIARVALAGRSDEDAVATLVHLAGHLSGVAQIDEPYDHDSAVAVEAQFRRDVARLDQ
jgi:hypothetical protein